MKNILTTRGISNPTFLLRWGPGLVSRTVGMFPYYWRVKTRLPERKGTPCRVLVRGKMNSALVEFEDGYRVVTSRNYLRKRRE
jgi:hypothetical protein